MLEQGNTPQKLPVGILLCVHTQLSASVKMAEMGFAPHTSFIAGLKDLSAHAAGLGGNGLSLLDFLGSSGPHAGHLQGHLFLLVLRNAGFATEPLSRTMCLMLLSKAMSSHGPGEDLAGMQEDTHSLAGCCLALLRMWRRDEAHSLGIEWVGWEMTPGSVQEKPQSPWG